MGIIFKLYSWIWLLILFLYSLHWSEFSQPLDVSLLVFLLITITISFIIGKLLKPYKIKRINLPSSHSKMITYALIFGFILNFAYAKYIPFLSLMIGNYSYVEFEGIPTLFPFLYTFSLFYYYCLIYYFSISRKKQYLRQAILLLIVFLSFFNRSLLVFAFLGTVLIMIFSYKRSIKQKIKLNYRNILIIVIIVFIVCYLFGVLGNIRVGLSWNDCSYIERLGMYTNYPEWLPKQFMWVYSYLISPLANLNNNIIHNNCDNNIYNLILSFIPEFISKRLFPSFAIESATYTFLIRTYFNAQTGFINFYYSYGIAGCYFCYFILMSIVILIYYICKKVKYFNPLIIVILGIFITMTFFYNVFYYTLTSLLLIWCVFYVLFSIKKIRIKIK